MQQLLSSGDSKINLEIQWILLTVHELWFSTPTAKQDVQKTSSVDSEIKPKSI